MDEILHIELSEERKANLKKLADFLFNKVDDKKFDMQFYMNNNGRHHMIYPFYANSYYSECGTVACAAGHGPIAGIEPLLGERWSSYIARVFTGDSRVFTGVSGRIIFIWLFDARWACRDNTAKGAAKRIYFLLEHNGVPRESYIP